MIRNLADSLVTHGKIKTTLAKARVVGTFVERMVTKAKVGGVTAERTLRMFLYTDVAINKLIKELAPKYQDRKGGYTRIVKLAKPRQSDAGETAMIEFV
jgi:large subunit ribosomal protein L17